jgi:hypothetical protein
MQWMPYDELNYTIDGRTVCDACMLERDYGDEFDDDMQ